MNYKDKASKITQKYSDVSESISIVKGISFDENWKGKGYFEPTNNGKAIKDW